MRAVSDDPKSIGPRDDSASAAFILVIKHREAGIDAGDLPRLSGERGCGKEKGEEQRVFHGGFRPKLRAVLWRSWSDLSAFSNI